MFHTLMCKLNIDYVASAGVGALLFIVGISVHDIPC